MDVDADADVDVDVDVDVDADVDVDDDDDDRDDRFRSCDLLVMGQPRFLCATSRYITSVSKFSLVC